MAPKIAQTLEDFDAVFDKKALNESNFENYYVETKKGRGEDSISTIIRKFRTLEDKNLKILFTGFKGTGKSTELLRLKRELEDDSLIKIGRGAATLYAEALLEDASTSCSHGNREKYIKKNENSYAIKIIPIKGKFGPYPLTISEILVPVMAEMLDIVNENFKLIRLSSTLIENLDKWLNSIYREEINDRYYEGTVSEGVDIKSGFGKILNVFTRLRLDLNAGRKKQEVDGTLSGLNLNCNLLVSEIKNQLHKINKQNIILIIEELEEIEPGIVKDIFYQNAGQLVSIPCCFIYTVPMSLFFDPKFKSIINEFDGKYFFPVIKVHDKSGEVHKPGIDNIIKIVHKRLDKDKKRISQKLLKKFIQLSGGCLRDLFQVLKFASGSALDRGRKKIELPDFQYALSKLKSEYYAAIGYNEQSGLSAADYYKILVDCVNSKDKKPMDVKGMTDLKHINAIMGYDVDTWFDVHPAVKEILKEKKLTTFEHPDETFPRLKNGESVMMIEDEYKEPGNVQYPPITLKRLTLHNIKCFKHVELSFEGDGQTSSWTVFVGDNGVGKTTILHCIALCALGPELASKIIPIPQSMLRIGADKGFIEAVFDAPIEAVPQSQGKPNQPVVIRLTIEKGSRTFEVDWKEDSPGSNYVKYFIEARKRTDFEGWFVAGYGAVRNLLFTDEPFKIAQQDPVIERVESLFDPTRFLIDPSSLYRFLSGDPSPFKEMGAPAKLNPFTIRYIRDLLDKLLPMVSLQASNNKVNGNLETPFGRVPITDLSEGYKSMLSWLAHLIAHLLAAVKWTGNINDIKGIVLIDEVDLHLHPGWQQQVIPLLRESFPNLQFIGCTHSPMTAGGADDGDIILLELQEGEILVRQDLPSIKGWRADQILTGPLFGLESSRDLTTRRQLDEYTELNGLSELSSKKKKRLNELESRLAVIIPSTGETEVEREAFHLIEKTMDGYLSSQTPEKKVRLLKEIKRQLKR